MKKAISDLEGITHTDERFVGVEAFEDGEIHLHLGHLGDRRVVPILADEVTKIVEFVQKRRGETLQDLQLKIAKLKLKKLEREEESLKKGFPGCEEDDDVVEQYLGEFASKEAMEATIRGETDYNALCGIRRRIRLQIAKARREDMADDVLSEGLDFVEKKIEAFHAFILRSPRKFVNTVRGEPWQPGKLNEQAEEGVDCRESIHDPVDRLRSLTWMNPDRNDLDEKVLEQLVRDTKHKIAAIRGGAPDRPRRPGLKVIDGGVQ